ncbi:glucosylglycerate synthase [Desulfacinum hydrothermale DSM 13146]|uniref:Glucosylglycerate synthase n=1 Tax=Desulfacinum hydrothermale DSM 13146 TaxID=1121390 RepID=A0A1W1X4Z2_9BACT|nr:glycosyltransferase [Desulfacinum hydrothermale]SMC18788.1 glucosylglycerate synthase [Desulfacinum hydrothermale DSM 13146]
MIHLEENPQNVTEAELVVAFPTFDEAASIGRAVEIVGQGLQEAFPDRQAVIINCDNHSLDGTRDAFLQAATPVPRIYLSTEPSQRGKGANLRMLFQKVLDLKAEVVVVLEADISNLSPSWVRLFAEPIQKGAAYVTPFYMRHKYENTLTSCLVYPMSRCLYGRRVRQLDAGDCAFRGDLAATFLDAPAWGDAVEATGIDVWMGTVALVSRVPVWQTFIGMPKEHRMKDPFAQLSVRFRQAVTTLFDLMGAYEDFWRRVKWSKPTALFNLDGQEVESPPIVEVNTSRLHQRFHEGFQEFEGLWREVFDPMVFNKLDEIRSMSFEQFTFPTHTWATLLFDAAAAYRRMGEDGEARSALVDSLLPLYLGKVVSYVKRTERMSIQQAEEHVEGMCAVFEESKPYLLEKWPH